MKKNKFDSKVSIKNKKASFNFELLDKYTTGIVLQGTEVKSVRMNKVSLTESYCFIERGEVFVKNMHIAPYDFGTSANHDPLRTRKLLLSKKEIKKIEESLKDKGLTLIVQRLYMSEKGWVKLDIAVAKGKKTHDKRESIKKRDVEREHARKY